MKIQALLIAEIKAKNRIHLKTYQHRSTFTKNTLLYHLMHK